MVLALALVFIGCGKPPKAEQEAAKAAMDAAIARRCRQIRSHRHGCRHEDL